MNFIAKIQSPNFFKYQFLRFNLIVQGLLTFLSRKAVMKLIKLCVTLKLIAAGSFLMFQ